MCIYIYMQIHTYLCIQCRFHYGTTYTIWCRIASQVGVARPCGNYNKVSSQPTNCLDEVIYQENKKPGMKLMKPSKYFPIIKNIKYISSISSSIYIYVYIYIYQVYIIKHIKYKTRAMWLKQ